MDNKKYRAMHAVTSRYQRLKKSLEVELSEQRARIAEAEEGLSTQKTLVEKRSAELEDLQQKLARRFDEGAGVSADLVHNLQREITIAEGSVRQASSLVISMYQAIQEQCLVILSIRQNIRQNDQRLEKCDKWFREQQLAAEAQQAELEEESFAGRTIGRTA